MRGRTPRRLSALAALALVASAVQVVALAAPVQADGCQAETELIGCDDITPPDTTLVAVRPAPTQAGYVRQTTVSFDFAGVPVDATDTGQIAFECQLFNTVTVPTAWQACESGKPYPGLANTTATPYIFRVRAVDTADAAVLCPVLPLCADAPDHDPTPATTTVKVDTTLPNTFMTRTPQDDIRPDWPVTLNRSPQMVLNTNEGGARFVCAVNDKPLTCGEGVVMLKDLKSGPQHFSARAVDAAGNADPTPSSTKLFVPDNVKASRGSGWQRVRKAGAFDSDLVRASKVGATLRDRRAAQRA